MNVVLLAAATTLAAITLPAAPAEAQDGAFTGRPAPSFHDGFGHGDRDFDRRDRRRLRDRDGDVFIGQWPQQGDTVWRSNSFNDWWHDQPLRSYPRWMLGNQNCERIWWSGSGWRC